MPTRRHVHTRNICAEVFVRDDGLWDVEAEMVDTKARAFMLASGLRPAGAAIHRMRLTITIDTQLNIIEAKGQSLDHPYPGYCAEIEPAYVQLVGLNLLKNFKRAVRERLGGVRGLHASDRTDRCPADGRGAGVRR